MRESTGRSLIGWLVLVAIIAAGAWFVSPWLLERTSQQSAAREERLAKRAQERKRDADRVAKGAVVQSTAQISPDETLTVLMVPWMSNGFARERMCIVYRSDALRTARLWCERDDDLLTIRDEP